MVAHLIAFDLDLRFSAGIWYFRAGEGRSDRSGESPTPIAERLDIAAGLAQHGLAGVEAHYPTEINEDNLNLWQDFSRDTGIRLLTMAPDLFSEPRWEWGSLSSPIPKVRGAAIERVIRSMQLGQALDIDFVILWPGADGYDDNLGLDMAAARDRLVEGIAQAMDAVSGMRILLEPQPYQPRGRLFCGTTCEGILLSLKVESLLRAPPNRGLLDEGHALCALNPEIGHMLMAHEDLPYALSLALEDGRLGHTHWNSQPLGSFDHDQNVGVYATEATEAALYIMKMHGYSGYFGIDINPERMPVRRAFVNNVDALRAANDRINSLDHESIIWSREHPEAARGWLEAHLIRKRAISPERLSSSWQLPFHPA